MLTRNFRFVVTAVLVMHGGTVAPWHLATLAPPSAAALSAQVLQPTPPPDVTAEGEPWFQFREPILFAGNVYYPAGPQTYFNRYEMVRTGTYGNVPLYARTTLETFSVIFVPLSGGLMQPYERRRSGELAGTVGSTTPSFPVSGPSESAITDRRVGIPQAPGPSMGYASMPTPAPVSTVGVGPSTATATTGADRPPLVARHVLATAARPEGLNGIYVVFVDERWFSSGPALTLAEGQFTQIGEHQGLPVYRERSHRNTIYVPVSASAGYLVAPYSRRDPR